MITRYVANMTTNRIDPIECIKANEHHVWVKCEGGMARKRRDEPDRPIFDTFVKAKEAIVARRADDGEKALRYLQYASRQLVEANRLLDQARRL